MNIKVVLVVHSIDLKANTRLVLLHNNNLLEKNVNVNCQPEEAARNLIADYLEVDANWPEVVLCDVWCKDGFLNLLYTTLIPNSINLKFGSWVSDLGELDGLVQKIISETVSKI